MPCNTISSLASSTSSSAYFKLQSICSPNLKSENFQDIPLSDTRCTSWIQLATDGSLSNSSSSLHIYRLPLVKSYFNTLINVQFADKIFFRTGQYQFSLGSALTLSPPTWRIWWAPNNASKWQMGFNSAFKGLIWSSLLCQMPSASSWSQNTISGLRLKFALMLFLASKLYPWFLGDILHLCFYQTSVCFTFRKTQLRT